MFAIRQTTAALPGLYIVKLMFTFMFLHTVQVHITSSFKNLINLDHHCQQFLQIEYEICSNIPNFLLNKIWTLYNLKLFYYFKNLWIKDNARLQLLISACRNGNMMWLYRLSSLSLTYSVYIKNKKAKKEIKHPHAPYNTEIYPTVR